MSEVKDVRAALEKLIPTPDRPRVKRDPVIAALISEGLAACDEWEREEARKGCLSLMPNEQVGVFASILRKAGLLK